MPSSPPSSAGAKPLPLTVLQWTTTGRSASSASPIASRSALHVVAVDHADVGEVELLEEAAPAPSSALIDSLRIGPEPLDALADARRAGA